MGAALKGALFLVGVLALGSLWEVSALIFASLLLPPVLARARRGGGPGGRGWGGHRGAAAGAVLLALAGVAVAEGGRLSPFAFGVPGALLLARPPVSSVWPGAKPVGDSVLLRGSLAPFRWCAVAELKFATRDAARALSGVEGRVLLLAGGEPRAFALFDAWSLTRRGAERALVGRMKSLASGVLALGAYVLPLDSAEAARVCALPPGCGGGASPAGVLARERGAAAVVEVRGGEVTALGLFVGRGGGGSALRRTGRRPPSRLLLGDVLLLLLSRGSFRADSLTAFLAGAAATAGEPMGERVTELAPEGAGVMAASPGAPKVPLTRAQLVAVMAVYP